MKPKRTMLPAAALAALALLAAGCGSSGKSSSPTTTTPSGTSSAEDWANGFCTAVTGWKNSVETAVKDVAKPSSLDKAGLQQAANEVKTANQKLVDDLKGLGAPNTASGEQVKKSVDQFATTLQDDVSKIEDTANGVSGLSGILSAASTISTTLAAMQSAFSSTLQTIDNADAKGELQDAFKHADSCKGLTS